MSTPQLLIAGGGIGAMAAALACARSGWHVRLYERAREFSEVGAGLQLGPNVTRVLQRWGLEEALHAVAAFPERLQVREALSGHVLAELPLGDAARTRYGAPYATLHRADLHRLLTQAAQREPNVSLHLGQWLAGFEQDMEAVRIRTVRGLEVEGDALIGADGVWSRVRQQLLDDGPPRVTGHLAYRAMLEQSALPEALRTRQITAWLGPRLHLVQYPVRSGRAMNVVAIVHGQAPADASDWDHEAAAADLARAMAAVCAPVRALIKAVPSASLNSHPWRLWALADRPPVREAGEMARGRVALLGDAAHPMRPYLAQGAGMAIEDAAELAQSLAMDAVDIPTRLKRYALARWQRVARVQARAVRNGLIYHARGPLRWGRDASLRWMGARLLDQRWLYEAQNRA